MSKLSPRNSSTSSCVHLTTLGLYLVLILLVFRTIALNCSETIILTPKDFSKIKIKFDFADAPAADEAGRGLAANQFGTTGSIPKGKSLPFCLFPVVKLPQRSTPRRLSKETGDRRRDSFDY